MRLNRGTVWLAGMAGGVVWTLWSFLVGRFVITDARYVAAQNAGLFLKTPRYPLFVVQWIVAFVYSPDRGRASLCLGTSGLGTWSRRRSEDRISGRLLRRLPE
jgi:hypothetical protein